jgi:hypothetical protein
LRPPEAAAQTTAASELADYDDGRDATVRVYDGAHGVNDMHRHNRRGEKAPATGFHAGTLGKGMRASIAAVRADKEIIAAWGTT